MKSDFAQYTAALDEYRRTVDDLMNELDALDYNADTQAIQSKILALMQQQVEALGPHLPKARLDRLEDIKMSLLDLDHEMNFRPDMETLEDTGPALPKNILARFLQVYRNVTI